MVVLLSESFLQSAAATPIFRVGALLMIIALVADHILSKPHVDHHLPPKAT